MYDVHFTTADCLLDQLSDESIDLIYIDPPFNTGKTQKMSTKKSTRSDDGVVGFQGKAYKHDVVSELSYEDQYDNYVQFLKPLLHKAHAVLKNTGAIFVHLDWREVHYIKVVMDYVFGRQNFINEIIWAYDYGGKPKTKFPCKHNNILYYVKDHKNYTFNVDAIEREPYMSPGLVTPEKAAKGKLPTDVWWHTIVPTNSKERTGYPTQKPEGVLRRIISAASNPGDLVLDFFAGSGTTGKVAYDLGRDFILVDNNPEAIQVMKKRFSNIEGVSFWYY